jgi:ABC-type glutathione transport system ATPase component
MNQDMLLPHPTVTGGEKGNHPIFAVERLRYRYPQAKAYAIDGIDFTIGEGEIFGFLGPSGARKSTTQKILIRLLQDYEGRITDWLKYPHGVKAHRLDLFPVQSGHIGASRGLSV